MSDTPCTASEAVERAKEMVNNGGQYLLGTGDYHPTSGDCPWTSNEKGVGSDCAGFAICWCWKLKRHRPGFNKGEWASVEDDINVNSIIEDAEHNNELAACIVAESPQPGDLLCYPTFYMPGRPRPFIGHVAIIETVSKDYKSGRFDLLTVIQCHGPDFFKPGVVRTDGSLFMHHDAQWNGKDDGDRRCKIVRMRERA
jgi:hypothetical protein